ncbi:venom peptide isomerase heavy chain-like [Zerene cesonia]|uniref:venom peptide isomerase heavy chain-like n=1 Tax=Zerene cesonia TaxID=33412 RepID=UPI0018E52007|nr:venom peptide isomerase heavy chain-like [Zerene cesonia]
MHTTRAPYFDDNEFVPRVVNGWPAKLGDVPYQVGFKMKIPHQKIYMTFCGGVIIAHSKLLSAAHCFANDPNFCQRLCGSQGSKRTVSHVYAVAGNLRNRDYYTADSSDSGQWRMVKTVTYPKTYKFPKDDIAVLFTTKPFIYNTHVNAIPFASRFTDYHGQCLVSGYGRISQKSTSSKLLLAHLDLIPIKTCNRMFRKNMRKFVCTSSRLTDVGKGDSGGPLVCMNTGDPNEKAGQGILVGIVSGHKYHVGSFFTRVSYFYRYVERNKSCPNRLTRAAIYFVTLLYSLFLF